MRNVRSFAVYAGFLSASMWLVPVASTAQENANFELMKATADKVWRLNKMTGEISVCSLSGERLVCTSSEEAIRPPTMTYEERQAEQERAKKESKAKDMAFFDTVLNAIRSLFEASLDRETTGN